jgi:hypothetical protein
VGSPSAAHAVEEASVRRSLPFNRVFTLVVAMSALAPLVLFGGGSASASLEGFNNNFFGGGAGASNQGQTNSFFGAFAGNAFSTTTGNSFFGWSAGSQNSTGSGNSFFGDSAGRYSTSGGANAFFGRSAGGSNTSGQANAFFGHSAGFTNTTGESNAFFGNSAGFASTGSKNAFFGNGAGYNNTADRNSFFGKDAGLANKAGVANSFFGHSTGSSNTGGFSNAFFGNEAGQKNTDGVSNSFFGRYAGQNNTTGGDNAFFGHSAGLSNTTESANAFLGMSANGVAGITNATAVGYRAQVSQSNSVVLGSIAGVNGAFSGAYVGIGTATPASPLHVVNKNGTAQAAKIKNASFFGDRSAALDFENGNQTPVNWRLGVAGTSNNLGIPTGTFYLERSGSGALLRVGPSSILAAGRRARANHVGATVFADAEEFDFASAAVDQFSVRATGGVRFVSGISGTGVPTAGVNLAAGGGSWSSLSDRNTKANVRNVDGDALLKALVDLPISGWSYKSQDARIRHIGPMAQDFAAAFGVGEDDKHITGVDADGVALAAIQALYELTQDQNDELGAQNRKLSGENAQLKAQNVELSTRLTSLERAVATLR